MADVNDTETTGVSRRDLLRRGAIVGAATVWTVPVVQAVSMRVDRAEAMSGDTPPNSHPPVVTPPHEVSPPPTTAQTTPVTPASSAPTTASSPTATSANNLPAVATDPSKSAKAVSTSARPSSSRPSQGIEAALVNQPQSASHSAARSALAFTGLSVPVASTAAIGLASVALGTGLTVAARRNNAVADGGPALDGPPADVKPDADQ